MLLIVDAGNTNVDALIYDGDNLVYRTRCATEREASHRYYQAFFAGVHDRYPAVEGFILSSVVPMITDDLYRSISALFKVKGLNVNMGLVDLATKLDHPEELGADLIATTYGTIAAYPLPAIVADLGTATKLSVIDKDACFLGGLIIPGLSISRKAMEIMLPHLPKIEMALPDKLLTNDTVKSMQAGLLYGTVYQIKGLAQALAAELGIKPTFILTGGYARFIKDELPEFTYDEHLLERGLLAIYKHYHQS